MTNWQNPTIELNSGEVVSISDVDRVIANIETECSTRNRLFIRFLDMSGKCSRWGLTGPALSYARKALDYADGPNLKANVYLRLGTLKERERDYAAAAAFYAEAFSLEPGKDDVWYFLNNNLGYSLNQIGKHRESEFYCRAAIGINPDRHNAYKNLGLSLQGQGRYVDAAQMLIRAVELYPADPRALNHLRDLVEAHREVITEEPTILVKLNALGEFADADRRGIMN